MSAPETFDMEIEFPARVTARIHGEDEIEIISVVLNPEHSRSVLVPAASFFSNQMRELRAEWFAAHKAAEMIAENERQASAAETRAHFRREP